MERPADDNKQHPKIIKGLVGWAIVDDKLAVYAKTKRQAIRRYQELVASDNSDRTR